jgi:hypothetical protein
MKKIKEPETIKDVSPQPITQKYFTDNQLTELRLAFFMENAPSHFKTKIEAIVYGSDGSIMVIYEENRIQKRKILNK